MAAAPISPAGLVITTPPMHECAEVQFKWVSDAGPFKAWLWSGTGGMGTILKDFGNIAEPDVGFVVDLARGYEVSLAVRDAAGHTVNSPPTTVRTLPLPLPSVPKGPNSPFIPKVSADAFTVAGDCPAGFKLRALVNDPGKAGDDDPKPSAPSTASPATVINTNSTKPADAPTPTFAPVPSKSVVTEPSVIAQFTGTDIAPIISTSPVDTSERVVAQAAPTSTIRTASTPTVVVSSGSSTVPLVPVAASSSALTKPQSSTISYYTSASSTYPIIPVQSEASSSESESKPNATMIAGIAGGVTCAVLFLSLILWVLCRHRRQNREFGDRTDDDFVHFTDTASALSFPPIYAAFRSETNLAGRGAGGGGVVGGEEYEKADMVALGGTEHPHLDHIPYSNPHPLRVANADDDSSSAYDMGTRPILDPAILGRSAPKLPKVRPATGSTWRSSFGAVFNWMAPLSPSPRPGNSFKLGGRGSRRYDGDASETLTSEGVSRTGTVRTERSALASAVPPSYRASVYTFANHPSSSLVITNPTTPTSAALAVLTSTSRSLLPRRQSGDTAKTARSRRSIATFGAADMALVTPAILPSPTSAQESGLVSAALPSPGSEDSFGDILADSTELAYIQPGPGGAPSAYRGGDLAAYRLPPIAGPEAGERMMGGRAEGVVSRVSIGKFERPRTLMFTRNSLAASAFGAGSSSTSVHTILGAGGGAGEGSVGHVEDGGQAGVKRGSVASVVGRWSEWRRSLRRSLGGQAEDDVGQAM